MSTKEEIRTCPNHGKYIYPRWTRCELCPSPQGEGPATAPAPVDEDAPPWPVDREDYHDALRYVLPDLAERNAAIDRIMAAPQSPGAPATSQTEDWQALCMDELNRRRTLGRKLEEAQEEIHRLKKLVQSHGEGPTAPAPADRTVAGAATPEEVSNLIDAFGDSVLAHDEFKERSALEAMLEARSRLVSRLIPPEWVCAGCGNTDLSTFKSVRHGSPMEPDDFDLECTKCGSLEVCESYVEALEVNIRTRDEQQARINAQAPTGSAEAPSQSEGSPAPAPQPGRLVGCRDCDAVFPVGAYHNCPATPIASPLEVREAAKALFKAKNVLDGLSWFSSKEIQELRKAATDQINAALAALAALVPAPSTPKDGGNAQAPTRRQ